MILLIQRDRPNNQGQDHLAEIDTSEPAIPRKGDLIDLPDVPPQFVKRAVWDFGPVFTTVLVVTRDAEPSDYH